MDPQEKEYVISIIGKVRQDGGDVPAGSRVQQQVSLSKVPFAGFTCEFGVKRLPAYANR